MPHIGYQVKTTNVVVIVAFMLGLFLSWGLFSGDEQGRVNLLHLVAVFVFLPIVSLLISSLSLVFGKGLNLAFLAGYIPFWSHQKRRDFLLQRQQPHSQFLFFYQSQFAAISFSLASLFTFFILLVSTDINFIWRSTLLNAEQIHPLLELLAVPWKFWPSAQPDLNLLIATQDSRLLNSNGNNIKGQFGDWWQFILAAQVFYAFSLRILVIVISLSFSKTFSRVRIGAKSSAKKLKDSQRQNLAKAPLAEIVNHIENDYALNNWCGISEHHLRNIEKRLTEKKTSELIAGPLASYSEQMVSERWQQTQLLIVKGWEPPLAELADFMQNGRGYLLPLDWNDEQLKSLKQIHLDEWRRFVQPLSRWQLLQLENIEC